MNPVQIERLGKGAFLQSIRPYKGREFNAVIFGLDSEYVPRLNEASEFISWQLATKKQVKLFTSDLSLENLYSEAQTMLGEDGVACEHLKTWVFVVYFSLAEVQFFNLEDWNLSEYKGKYRLRQHFHRRTLMLVDLIDWFPHQPLKNVAKLWGFEKADYPIGEKVEQIVKGELTKEELLKDPAFLKYAKNDAVLTQRIYSLMREKFSRKGVDIVSSMTPAQTSACMFRQRIKSEIEQKNTALRKLALNCCWGGRMECLFRGEMEQCFEYDATGHHPNSAIALSLFPLETDWKKTQSLTNWLGGVSGLGKVYFKFPDDELFPCLPVFYDNALLFPLEGVSFCTASEVRLAKEQGAKLILLDGYFYNSGTKVLTEYLKELQDIRNNSKDPAERELFKLLSNSIIGKFFQKSTGIDLSKVQKFAREHQLPLEVALTLKGEDFGNEKAKVGSCFYPEWYALILGYARASISKVSREHDALIISSDSFVTQEELASSFTTEGITFNRKESGTLISYRTRFYRVGEKLAHHAVHSREAGKKVLESFLNQEEFSYGFERMLNLRESFKVKLPFGARIFREMTTDLGFDFKRRLLEDGTTIPWKSIEEREEFLGGKEVNDD